MAVTTNIITSNLNIAENINKKTPFYLKGVFKIVIA